MTREILVVDDDLDIREIVAEILTDAGYTVVTARNGIEALEVLKARTPALVLLDLNMPLMDGVEFRRRQMEDARSAKIPTVVMSAVDRMHERLAGLPVDGALAKPVELKRLLEVVAQHCTG